MTEPKRDRRDYAREYAQRRRADPAYRERQAAQDAARRAADPDRFRENKKRAYDKLKAQMIAAYGGVCTCCGETEPIFLALDHVKGRDGTELRGQQEWRRARALGWPDTFTVLCHNCNMGRAINGGTCPHQS